MSGHRRIGIVLAILIAGLGFSHWMARHTRADNATLPNATASHVMPAQGIQPTASFVSRPVTGSVVLQGGACCVGGTAGSPVAIRAAYAATSTLAQVTDMRTAARYGGGCLKEAAMASIPWEPFSASGRFTVTAAINWIGFYVSAQYRDAQGNLSPVVCDDVSVEGMPPATPPTAVNQATRSPAPTVLPAPTANPGRPGVCSGGAIALAIVGLALCARLILGI